MRFTFLILISLLSSFAFAQNSIETVGTIEMAETKPESAPTRHGIAVYLNGWPLPVNGMGGAIEYRMNPRYSIWAGTESEYAKKGMNSAYGQKLQAVVTSKNHFLGGRYYYADPGQSGFFNGAGYKWTTVDVKPEFEGWSWFRPDVDFSRYWKTYDRDGPYATIGYRVKGRRNEKFDWTVDVSLSYEPGEVKDVRAIIDETAPDALAKAYAETEFGYGFFPEARFGMQF